MKQIYIYRKSTDYTGVSGIHRIVETKDLCISIHHELKNGVPFDYWFSTFIAKKFRVTQHDEPYISFDIRDIWKHIKQEEPKLWYKMPPRNKLKKVCEIIQIINYETPEKFIQQCRKWEIERDIPF